MLSGRKWWASGAMDPRCRICIFMGKTDPSAPTHKQQSMILVPMASPGVTIVRPLTVYGYDDAPHGHAELLFEVHTSDFRSDQLLSSRSMSSVYGEGTWWSSMCGDLPACLCLLLLQSMAVYPPTSICAKGVAATSLPHIVLWNVKSEMCHACSGCARARGRHAAGRGPRL